MKTKNLKNRILLALSLLSLLSLFSTPADADVVIKSGTTTNTATVDANGNLNVTLPSNAAQAGNVKITDDNGWDMSSSGAFEGGAATVGAHIGRMKVGLDTLQFMDDFEGSTVNDSLWQRSFTAAHTAYALGFANSALTINSAPSTAATSSMAIMTSKWFTQPVAFPNAVRFVANVPNLNVTCNSGASCSSRSDGEFCAMGWGTWATPTTVSIGQITNGCYIQFSSSGVYAVATYNSVDTSAVLTNPSTTNYTSYQIRHRDGACDYVINGAVAASIVTGTGQGGPAGATVLPIFARCGNNTAGVASAAPTMKVMNVSAYALDNDTNKPWSEKLAGYGRHSAVSPVSAYGQTANWTNTTGAAACAASNTALGTNCSATLGGVFTTLTTTNAVWTLNGDGIITDYTVPAGYQLYITRARVDAFISTTVVTPPIASLCWFLGHNSSATSLATTAAAPTAGVAQAFAPIRVPIGCQSSTTLTAGTAFIAADMTYNPPLVVEAGRHVVVAVRQMSTTWTAGAITGAITLTGYHE